MYSNYMKSLTLSSALQTFNRLFDSAQREMFKAEVLQDYTIVDDSPSLRAWLAGDEQGSIQLGAKDKSIVAYRNKCLQSPARITRVHVVKTPYTPYLEWEIAVCYKDSLIAHNAESILLIDLDGLDYELPTGDFWIFDDKLVLQWRYKDGVGEIVGATIWDEADGDNIDEFRRLRSVLLSKAHRVVV